MTFLNRSSVRVHVPDRVETAGALARVTHLGIGAHQDDLEFFAFHGIGACVDRQDRWFAGVTCCDGSGSPRRGAFSELSDAQMAVLRLAEQEQAADLGAYAAMVQLGYSSREIKEVSSEAVVEDLEAILRACRPNVLYLHNPADKHDTHVATLLRSLEAVRRLPKNERPDQAWGCEVWRDLDWMLDDDKVLLSTSDRKDLQESLNEVFRSQILGGKRYDQAVMGRRLANATFLDSHLPDEETGITFAMDLSPVIQDDRADLVDYTNSHIERFMSDVSRRIEKFSRRNASL